MKTDEERAEAFASAKYDKYSEQGQWGEIYYLYLAACAELRAEFEGKEREAEIFFTMDWAFNNPHDGRRESNLMWFWRDENCEEPIGPFDTREEAIDDYNLNGLLQRRGF